MRAHAALFLSAASLTLLAGCASPGSEAPEEAVRDTTAKSAQETSALLPPVPTAQPDPKDVVAQAGYWASVYKRDPSNTEALLNYAISLRKVGSVDKAHQVLVDGISKAPANPQFRAEYGKTLLVLGRTDEAVTVLEQAAKLAPKDWKIRSAAGIAFDQAGDHSSASSHYEAALELQPNNATVLNNYGLSRALGGDLAEAEIFLRRAVRTGFATPQMRQNLALVVGLQGNFEEAERLARADLPVEVAQNNVAYLKELLSQPDPWQELRDVEKKVRASQ